MKSLILYFSLLFSGEKKFSTGDCVATPSMYGNKNHSYAIYKMISQDTSNICITQVISEEYWENYATGKDEIPDSLRPGSIRKFDEDCNQVFRAGNVQRAHLVECPEKRN